MSYVEILPDNGGTVTTGMRKAFIALSLAAEPRGTIMFSLSGERQDLIRREGSFHHEGRYLLRAVAKNWWHDSVASESTAPSELVSDSVFKVILHDFVAYSSARNALAKVFPGEPILHVITAEKLRRASWL